MHFARTIANDLAVIRERKPLIHSITNLVVMNETANAILCLGALPIMSHAVEEVEEMAEIAGALVLNIGTLTPRWVEAMALAGKRANDLGVPVILDPVGAGASKLRTESGKYLLDEVNVSIVRGNSAEIAVLAGLDAEVRGVESISTEKPSAEIARNFAESYGTVAAVTGAVDVVDDGNRRARISNGHVMLSRVVGTGCISDVIAASFAAVQPDPFTAAIGGLTALGIAGEMAADAAGEKPGTFHVELYNSLYALTPEIIEARARVELD